MWVAAAAPRRTWHACWNEIGLAMEKEIGSSAQEIADSKIPAQLKGLFPEPPFLDGQDPNLYRNLLAAVIDERQPKTVTDWIAVHDLVTKLWEEQVFRRASNALIRGGMIKAVAHFVRELKGGGEVIRSKAAVRYFSKDPKERTEIRSRLGQYGIGDAELHAKSAQDNSDALQMFERMNNTRQRGRRRLDKDDRRRRRDERREAAKASEA
jgi:hypothetical protein